MGVSEPQSGSEEVGDLAASTVLELSPFMPAAGAEFSVTEGPSRTCTVGIGSGAVVGTGLEIPLGPCPADWRGMRDQPSGRLRPSGSRESPDGMADA